MSDGPLRRRCWRVTDNLGYAVTLARLRILDALAGPEPETRADQRRLHLQQPRLREQFVADSLLEGTGFEPSVPPAGHRSRRGTKRPDAGRASRNDALAERKSTEIDRSGQGPPRHGKLRSIVRIGKLLKDIGFLGLE